MADNDPVWAEGSTMDVAGVGVFKVIKVRKNRRPTGILDEGGFGDGETPEQIPRGYVYEVFFDCEVIKESGGSSVSTVYNNTIAQVGDAEKWSGNAWVLAVVMTASLRQNSLTNGRVHVLFHQKPTINAQS